MVVHDIRQTEICLEVVFSHTHFCCISCNKKLSKQISGCRPESYEDVSMFVWHAAQVSTDCCCKVKSHPKPEIESDQIEFELHFHMLLLFYVSSLTLVLWFSLVFSILSLALSHVPFLAQFAHHLFKWFTDAKWWIYSASFALILWFSKEVFAHTHFPENTSG